MDIDEEKAFTPHFADDQVVITDDEDDLHYMLRQLDEHCEKWGLAMNIKKIKQST